MICIYYSVFAYVPVSMAANPDSPSFVCGQDLNNNGYLGDQGEYTSCKVATLPHSVDANTSCPSGYVRVSSGGCAYYSYTTPSDYCPAGSWIQNGRCVTQVELDATPLCPYGTINKTYSDGRCAFTSKDQACTRYLTFWPDLKNLNPSCSMMEVGNSRSYRISHDAFYECAEGELVGGKCRKNLDAGEIQKVCSVGQLENGQCKQTTTTGVNYSCTTGKLSGTKCVWNTTENYCPVGATDSCVNSGGGASCSSNKCIDLNKNQPVDDGSIDGKTLVDDGEKSEDGVCLDQIYIFNGRASDCKLAGVSTAFKNCCKSEGKVYSDDVGPSTTIMQTAGYVKDVYSAAMEAYEYYTVAMQATADTAIASSMAADAFVNALMATVNPASIAIAIAIHFVMEYLMKACDQMSMETAMEAGSGMCHEVGTYCKKRVPLLGCVQQAKSYCCFSSMLGRIIQEQGRPQLTTFNGWGKPESPQCRGFTPEEFQQLDFAKIDLSEYVEEMVTAATAEIQQNVTNITQSFYDKTN